MISLIRKLCGLVLVLATGFGLGGCASGPAFQPATASSGQAVIYIYRPSSMLGAALSPIVVVNQSEAHALVNGAYYAVTIAPQKVVVAVNHTGHKELEIDAKAGETYYVSAGIGPFGIPKAELVEKTAAMADLKDCKLAAEQFQKI